MYAIKLRFRLGIGLRNTTKQRDDTYLGRWRWSWPAERSRRKRSLDTIDTWISRRQDRRRAPSGNKTPGNNAFARSMEHTNHQVTTSSRFAAIRKREIEREKERGRLKRWVRSKERDLPGSPENQLRVRKSRHEVHFLVERSLTNGKEKERRKTRGGISRVITGQVSGVAATIFGNKGAECFQRQRWPPRATESFRYPREHFVHLVSGLFDDPPSSFRLFILLEKKKRKRKIARRKKYRNVSRSAAADFFLAHVEMQSPAKRII